MKRYIIGFLLVIFTSPSFAKTIVNTNQKNAGKFILSLTTAITVTSVFTVVIHKAFDPNPKHLEEALALLEENNNAIIGKDNAIDRLNLLINTMQNEKEALEDDNTRLTTRLGKIIYSKDKRINDLTRKNIDLVNTGSQCIELLQNKTRKIEAQALLNKNHTPHPNPENFIHINNGNNLTTSSKDSTDINDEEAFLAKLQELVEFFKMHTNNKEMLNLYQEIHKADNKLGQFLVEI